MLRLGGVVVVALALVETAGAAPLKTVDGSLDASDRTFLNTGERYDKFELPVVAGERYVVRASSPDFVVDVQVRLGQLSWVAVAGGVGQDVVLEVRAPFAGELKVLVTGNGLGRYHVEVAAGGSAPDEDAASAAVMTTEPDKRPAWAARYAGHKGERITVTADSGVSIDFGVDDPVEGAFLCVTCSGWQIEADASGRLRLDVTLPSGGEYGMLLLGGSGNVRFDTDRRAGSRTRPVRGAYIAAGGALTERGLGVMALVEAYFGKGLLSVRADYGWGLDKTDNSEVVQPYLKGFGVDAQIGITTVRASRASDSLQLTPSYGDCVVEDGAARDSNDNCLGVTPHRISLVRGARTAPRGRAFLAGARVSKGGHDDDLRVSGMVTARLYIPSPLSMRLPKMWLEASALLPITHEHRFLGDAPYTPGFDANLQSAFGVIGGFGGGMTGLEFDDADGNTHVEWYLRIFLLIPSSF